MTSDIRNLMGADRPHSSRNRARRMKAARARSRSAVASRDDALGLIRVVLGALLESATREGMPSVDHENGSESSREALHGRLRDNCYSEPIADLIEALESRIALLATSPGVPGSELSGPSECEAGLREAMAGLERRLAETGAEADRLRSENQGLVGSLHSANEERSMLEGELAESQAGLSAALRNLEMKETLLDALSKERDADRSASDDELRELRALAESLRENVEALSAELEEARHVGRREAVAREKAEDGAAALDAELARTTLAVEDMRRELEAAMESAEESEDRASGLSERVAELDAMVESLHGELAAATAREASRAAEKFELTTRIEELEGALGAKAAEAADAAYELSVAREELSHALDEALSAAEEAARADRMGEELEAAMRDLDSARSRAEKLASRLSDVRQAWLPMPPTIRFGEQKMVLLGSGFQQMTVRELLYKQDGSVWAGDGSSCFARVGTTAQWDGGQL